MHGRINGQLTEKIANAVGGAIDRFFAAVSPAWVQRWWKGLSWGEQFTVMRAGPVMAAGLVALICVGYGLLTGSIVFEQTQQDLVAFLRILILSGFVGLLGCAYVKMWRDWPGLNAWGRLVYAFMAVLTTGFFFAAVGILFK